MNMTRLIRNALVFLLVWAIAAVAEAQRGFGPSIPTPQPYRPPVYVPPTPVFPHPNTPHIVVPQPVQPQIPVFIKRCSRCGHEVPITSCDGQHCPYCGVVWGAGPNTGLTTVRHSTSVPASGNIAVARERIPRALIPIIATLVAMGLVGGAALIWHYCQPAPKTRPQRFRDGVGNGFGRTAFNGPAGTRRGGPTDFAPDWLDDSR